MRDGIDSVTEIDVSYRLRRLRYYLLVSWGQTFYLVQDPDYSYAYSDGALTVVYDADGNIISDDLARQQADIAARYLARARALYAASVQEHHEAVAQAAWDQQQERVYTDRQRWREKQDQDAAWRAYHDAHLQNEQSHWAMERYRRAAEASRFALTINNTIIVARAAQALSDSAAEARRFGHDVGGPAPSGSLANHSPSTHDQGPPGTRLSPGCSSRHGGQSSQPPESSRV